MIKNNFKAILFASLIVALIVPLSGGMYADAQRSETNMIDKPGLTTVQQTHIAKLNSLVEEQILLMDNGSQLREKYQADSTSLSEDEITILETIQQRLNEIRGEFVVINKESIQLHAIDTKELQTLVSAQKSLEDSTIPIKQNGVDQLSGALYIGFDTQEEADKYRATLEDLLDVPFYLEIGIIEENYACTDRDDDCTPLT